MAPRAASEFACPQSGRTNKKRRSPVRYSQALADRILERLGEGERWSAIAGEPGLPTHTVVYKWGQRNAEFARAWAAAQRMGANVRADRVLDIAEKSTPETLSVDRAHIGALKWHVDRDAKVWGLREEEPDRGKPGQTLIIRVRQFTLYTDETGVERVREVLPDELAGAKRLEGGR